MTFVSTILHKNKTFTCNIITSQGLLGCDVVEYRHW